VRGARPLRTPWRFVVAGSLATVSTSDMATDLAPPSRLRDTRWIEPGTVAWSWPTEPLSPGVPARQQEYVDFAARNGLEYVLIDAVPDPSAPSGGRAGTDLFGAGLDEFTARARRRGVGVLAWEHADRLVNPERRRAILTRLARAGIAGVKVDFFDADHQGRQQLLDAILRETARLRLIVNLHGASLPTGLERTWPHVLTVEAVRGTEYHDLHDMLPGIVAAPDPRHEAILPFTRNVMGPMDYTPAAFSELAAAGRTTTAAHELALTVVFTSGLLHLADAIEEYSRRPAALRFLRDLPTAWDESRLLAGSPGRDVAVARRRGERWYVGAVTAGPGGLRRLSLAFLRPGRRYRLTLVTDGPAGLVARRRSVTRDTRVILRLAGQGGAVLRLTPR
jgi:alpha-glucosidase